MQRLLIAAVALGVTMPAILNADCGSIPIGPAIVDGGVIVSPVKKHMDDMSNRNPSVDFDPLKVTVFEPKQRALIVWNGEEQILLLSTDQRSSEPATVLEVIPFPAEPTVRLGSFETFHRAQEFVVRNRTWAVAHPGADAGSVTLPEEAFRVSFEQQLGAHDLAVFEVKDKGAFGNAVSQYLKEKYELESAPIKPEFLAMIDQYIADGYSWFAFDRIALGDGLQSREPIEYRFATDKVFYPMRISTLEKGETNVEALVVARDLLDEYYGIPQSAFRMQSPLGITRNQLDVIEPSWAGFFGEGEGELTMHQWEIRGHISSFNRDVLID